MRLRTPSSARALAVIWLSGILLLASSCSPASGGNPWMFDASSHPSQASLLHTTLKDPESKGYLSNPLHSYDAGDLTAEQILDWYQENMATSGWTPWARDDHQVIFMRRGPKRSHVLKVAMSGNWDELGDGAVDGYTVEEYEAEL
jgi:hypothetical protein